MKLRLILTLLTLAVLALGWPCSVNAQAAPTPLLKVDVPFDFIAAGIHLRAGTYDVLHVSNPNLILIRSTDRKAHALLPVTVSLAGDEKAVTKLIFNRYGDQHFLSQVWTGPDKQVHQCFKCPAEEALMASQKADVMTITAKP